MSVAQSYERFIGWVGDTTGASDALLHVHAGMLVLVAARLVTGRSLATPVPFAVVCLAEISNEVLDWLNHGSWRWNDTSTDVLNTLFWPFVLMIGLRLRQIRSAPLATSQQAELAGGIGAVAPDCAAASRQR